MSQYSIGDSVKIKSHSYATTVPDAMIGNEFDIEDMIPIIDHSEKDDILYVINGWMFSSSEIENV